MPRRVELRALDGPLRGRRYALPEPGRLLLGRSSDCDISIPDDASLSRRHCELELTPFGVTVRDLDSRHGTYVNERRHGGRQTSRDRWQESRASLLSVELKDGDRLRVGNSVFSLSIELDPTCSSCGADLSIEPRSRHPHGRQLCPICRARGTDVDDTFEVSARGRGDPERSVGGYVIGRPLGEGSFGTVYRATRAVDGAEVALKLMQPDTRDRDRQRREFLREMTVASQLRHPNIISLLDFGAEGDQLYQGLELCHGGSLADLLARRGGKLTIEETLELGRQFLAGLAHAHEHGIVHRDIKPGNLLLTHATGGMGKVADFGLAKSFELAGLSAMTRTGAVGGTANYMPREQITNFKYVRPTSDVWSMGAVFCMMLSGRYPRDLEGEKDIIRAILEKPIIPLRQLVPHVPHALEAVIERALAVEPCDRFPDARAFLEAIEGAGFRY